MNTNTAVISQQPVFRHELKYYLSNTASLELEQRLSHILNSDAHNTNKNGYMVRSLYFDSITDECLFDKQSGIKDRQKYRLRIYDPASNSVKFEIKHKINNQVYKETVTIDRNLAEQFIRGDFHKMKLPDNPVLRKIYAKFVSNHYRPKVVVEYNRSAYVFEGLNIRVTFDRLLRSNNTYFDIFSNDLPLTPVILEGKQILEIKYNEYIPDYIYHALQTSSFERMAISKYTLSRRYLKMGKWEDN